jgi:hypothetical protein
VADLRVVLDREQGQPTLRWATTHERLRPGRDDGFAYPVPFSVLGRSTREVIAEFEPSGDFDWSPSSDVAQPLRLQGRIYPSDDWVDLVAFDWWPPAEAKRDDYIAYRNEPGAERDVS